MSTWNKMHATKVKHRLAEAGIQTAELAVRTGIPYGTLRNAVAGRDPMRLDRIYDVARVVLREGEQVRDVVAEILVDNADIDALDEPSTRQASV